MSASEEPGMLSLDQQKQLAKVLAETKSLMKQQEKLISKVLKGEKDIGNTRLAYLEEYNEGYSSLLNFVSDQFKAINSDFLNLSKQITKNAKTLKSSNSSTDPTDSGKKGGSRKSKTASGGTDSQIAVDGLNTAVRGLTAVITDLRNAIKTGKPGADTSTATEGGDSKRKGRKGKKGGAGASSATSNLGGEGGGGVGGDELNVDDLKTTREDILKFLDEIAKDGIAAYTQEAEVKARQLVQNENQLQEWAKTEEAIRNSMLDLAIAKLQTQEELEKRSIEVRLARLKEATDAELELQNKLNNIASEIAFASTNEGGDARSRKVSADDELKSVQELEAKRIKWVEKQELEAKRKNNGVLTKEEATRIQKEAANKFKFDKENLKKLNEERIKLDAAKAHAAERAELRNEIGTLTSAETFEERKQALYNLTHDESGDVDVGKAMSAAVLAISDLAKKLKNKVDEIGKYKGEIDTRLQGSGGSTRKSWKSGSYWDNLTDAMMSVGAFTPFFKQEDFANNIKTLVNQGISFDLKQRAFLMTIQEKIANTFNVADGTLLRLIRIQQEDSTAGRLGMESALNSFLNEMYETSEYLTDVASSVRTSLEEMESLMSGAAATEVEYQVQKWMGSLYSVGMSQNAVTAISNALGQIASGQVDALTNGGAGNLLVMAANDAGIPIADILANGLDAKETNKLLQATVNYLAEIAESSKGNNVVQQQLADVFGVKASDLRAATNLATKGTTNDIFEEYKTYDNMIKQLRKMADSMIMRTSVGEFMTNVWDNAQYSIASGMASNPLSYLTYKLAGLLDSAVGGIDLPFLNVMGFGVDLNTTVSDLMRLASVGGGLLGSLGPMINGLFSSFSGSMMLNSMGIKQGSGLKVTQRGGLGAGDGLNDGLDGGGQKDLSGSGTIGNGNGSDVKSSTIQESEDSKKKQMIKAKEEEPANKVDVLNTTVIKIYELLDNVTKGTQTLRVRVDSYGLTGANTTGALGGVSGLQSNSDSSSGLGELGSDTGGSSVGTNSGRGTTGLGGWTMT